MKQVYVMLIVLAGCLLHSHGNNSDESSGQSSVKNMSLQFRVEEAPEWTALFNRGRVGLAEMVFFQFH